MESNLAENTELERELEALRARVAELEGELARRSDPSATSERRKGAISDSIMLRALLNDLPDCIFFKDRESRFQRIGWAHTRKFGLSDPCESIGKTDFDYFTEEHARPAYEDEQRIIATGEPLTSLIEKETWPDGRVTWVSTTKAPLRDERGAIIGVFGLTRDVTEVKLMEQRLDEERKLLRTLIDCLPEYIYVKDRDGRYIANNAAFLQLAGGKRQEEVTGKTVYDIYPKDLAEKFDAADHWVYATGEAFIDMAEQRRLIDGREHFLMVTKVPFKDDAGNVIGLVGVSHDVTALNQANRKLEKYAAELDEANVELKKFTYIVSHDLRAPLVNLKGFSMELRAALEVIRQGVEPLLAGLDPARREELQRALCEEAPEALEFINTSVSRMDGFINALLLLSRLGHRELKMEPLDMNEMVYTTLKTLAHQIEQRKVKVEVQNLPPVTADKTSMEQIWANLLNNAIIYMMPGRPGTIHVRGERREEETVFFVRDNGRGIRAEDMEKVFAPFRRAGRQDVPGEGMGLSYVQALVRRHGGSIHCESEEGVGTVFMFSIQNEGTGKGDRDV